jgi:putative ABC transport system permease protein
MSWRRHLAKFGALFRRPKLGDDLKDEIRSHLEMEERENLESGMPSDEAHYAALRRFGNVTLAQERSRNMWVWNSVETLFQDLRYGLRQLRRSPGFAAVALLTLALGIGANTVMFTVADAVLLRPLPFPHPDRLVMLWRTNLKGSPSSGTLSYPEFLDYRRQDHAFSHMAAFRSGVDFTLTGRGQAARLRGAVVSADIFRLLGVQPILGRGFSAADDKPAAAGLPVVISHQLWVSEFGSDRDIVGSSTTINREPFTVTGVMPAGFQFPIQAGPVDMWTTMAYGAVYMNQSIRSLYAVGRLKPGVVLRSAQAEMDTIAHRLASRLAPTNTDSGIWLQPLSEAVAGNLRPVLLALLGAVGCVLLIACVDLANLSLARLAARRQEMAVRATVGAGSRRLARQLLTETTLLSLAGGGLGFLIAYMVTPVLIRLSPGRIPRVDAAKAAHADWRVFVFALAVAAFTGLASGLAPAIQVWRTPFAGSIKQGWRGLTAGLGAARFRQFLVVTELALSAVLLIGAGLLIRSMWQLIHVDAGFNPTHAETFKIDLPERSYPPAQQTQFFGQLLARIRAESGVQAAGGAEFFPFAGVEFDGGFDIEGAAPGAPKQGAANFCLVTPGYFRAMGISVLRGRAINNSDRRGSMPVVVVSRSLAERYLSGQDPIGQRLALGSPVTIAGVVADVRDATLTAPPFPTIYIPLAQQPADFPKWPMTLIVRSGSNPDALVPAIRAAVSALDKNVPVYDVHSLGEYMAISEAQSRFNAAVLAIFAGLGLVLASAGLYGVTSYAVTQRTHEVGIRVALGAERGDILRLMLTQSMKLALAGVILGLGGALALTRLLQSFLFGVKALDPATFLTVAAILVIVLLISTFVPARRAAKVDPIVALRYE